MSFPSAIEARSISLDAVPPSSPFGPEWLAKAARRALDLAAVRAAQLDRIGAFPDQEVATLAADGLLAAPLPVGQGGLGLGTQPAGAGRLLDLLRAIGRASLPLGRLVEGHINAVALIFAYGRPDQQAETAHDLHHGRLFAVWNTEGDRGLRLHPAGAGRLTLEGGKIFCSGAGRAHRALVTASDEATGEQQMILLRMENARATVDLAGWHGVHGMRASVTGSVELSGTTVATNDLLGGPGDYLRQPRFSGGAWRFAAVQLGGIEALLDALREHLRRSGRGDAAVQRARFGEAMMASEAARLWLERAALLAESAVAAPPETVVAYVNLARLAVERAALDVLERVHRSIGMAAFGPTHPVGRISRDLQLYLRQPAPDLALDEAAWHGLRAPAPIHALWLTSG